MIQNRTPQPADRTPQPLIPVRLTPREIALICSALRSVSGGDGLSGRLAAAAVQFKTRRS